MFKLLSAVLAIFMLLATIITIVNDRLENLWVTIPAVFIFTAAFIALRNNSVQEKNFQSFLIDNADIILTRGARYKGFLITENTLLTQYLFSLSVITMSFKIPSRVYIVEHESTLGTAIGFTLASFFLGWWGIPWGPIFTIQAIGHNLQGGLKMTVGEYLTPAEPEKKSPVLLIIIILSIIVIFIIFILVLWALEKFK